ncbi:MAG: hypothetical protein Q9219_003965 [cf. Caloplaca sp. 3 TL-2023]
MGALPGTKFPAKDPVLGPRVGKDHFRGRRKHPRPSGLIHHSGKRVAICRHTYGPVEIELRIRFFLYDGTPDSGLASRHVTFTSVGLVEPKPGTLGALLEYRHSYPAGLHASAPRLLCPHLNLQSSIERLFLCRKNHRYPEYICGVCHYQIEQCATCQTELLDFRQIEDVPAGMNACCYRIEGCLDDENWPMQTIFPYARRQLPLSSGSISLT